MGSIADIATPLDVAAQVDPDVRRDVFFDDDDKLIVGKLKGQTVQSWGQFFYDSASNEVRIEATKDGVAVAPDVVWRTGDPLVEQMRLFSTGDWRLDGVVGSTGVLRWSKSKRQLALSGIDPAFVGSPGASVRAHFETQGTDLIFFLDVYSSVSPDDEPEIIGRRARGTKAAPLAVLAGDCLYDYEAHGYDGTVFGQANGDASIIFIADENFAVGSHGTRMEFFTTIPGSGVRSQRAAFRQNTLILRSPFTVFSGETLRVNHDFVVGDTSSGILLSRSAATARDYDIYIADTGALRIRDVTAGVGANRIFLNTLGNVGIGLAPNTPYGVPAKLTIHGTTVFFNVDATAGSLGAFLLSVAGVGKWAFINDPAFTDRLGIFNAALTQFMSFEQTGLIAIGAGGVAGAAEQLEIINNAASGVRWTRTAATARTWRYFIDASGNFNMTDVTGAVNRVQYTPAGSIILSPVNQGLRINNQVDLAGAAAGTITNAPTAGNPAFWLPINIAGTVRAIPCWAIP